MFSTFFNIFLISIYEMILKNSNQQYDFNYKELFPSKKLITRFEGGAFYKAEKKGKYYLIIDSGTMADFIDEDDRDLLDQLIKIIEFDTEDELNKFYKDNYV